MSRLKGRETSITEGTNQPEIVNNRARAKERDTETGAGAETERRNMF